MEKSKNCARAWFGCWTVMFLTFLTLILMPTNGSADHSGKISATVEVQWCGSVSVVKPGTTWTVPESITEPKLNVATFILKPGKINCKEEKNNGVSLKLNVTRKVTTNSESFLPNGYFRTKEMEYFHPKEYCISGISNTTVDVELCKKSVCGSGNPCIPLCCPLGLLFSPGVRKDNASSSVLTCLPPHPGSSPFSPVLYSNANKRTNKDLFIHYRRKKLATFRCANNASTLLLPFATNEAAMKQYGSEQGLCFRIQEDGTLLYRNTFSEWGEAANDDYCIGGFRSNSSDKPFGAREEDFGVLLCSLPPVQPVPFHSVFYGSTMIVASIFLLLTLLVHILLWNQQNIHGWTTMCHAASMFFMYLFLGTVFLLVSTYGYELSRTLGCKIIGIITHFFFLSTFCWLTLINFDLFWTFRCMAPRSQRSKGIGRFILYMLFGWGLPFVFVTISVIVDFLYASERCSMVLTPDYGMLSCYVSKYALGRYVYYPVAVLWSVNLLFFATTTYKLYVYKKSTRIATQNMNERQQLFQLFMKLFFVMGFTWIFEFLSWLHAGNEMKWYWTIFDIINLLQAVAIFIIFVCKPDILCSLQNKYPALKPLLRPMHICLMCRTPARESEACTSYTTADDAISSKSSMKIKPSMRISS